MRLKMVRIFLVLSTLILGLSANCATIHYYNNNTNKTNTVSKEQTTDPYKEDLIMVERGIFGRIYATDNLKTRLSRIERRMFNRIYPSLSTSQRMNNILTNYENGTGYCGNTYYGDNLSLKNRLINSFIGQPTGLTPPVYPSPYINTFGPSYMRGAYGSNGWRYHNMVRPVMTRAGVHILD